MKEWHGWTFAVWLFLMHSRVGDCAKVIQLRWKNLRKTSRAYRPHFYVNFHTRLIRKIARGALMVIKKFVSTILIDRVVVELFRWWISFVHKFYFLRVWLRWINEATALQLFKPWIILGKEMWLLILWLKWYGFFGFKLLLL